MRKRLAGISYKRCIDCARMSPLGFPVCITMGRFGMIDLNLTVSTLCKFFCREVPRLPLTYVWNIPEIEGFVAAGESRYEQNLDLKTYLSQQWASASSERRLELAKVIVSDWGGVRGNRPETLERYVQAISTQAPSTPLKGVASYSKIFSIVRPDIFAIYDARVAGCLNAVQINDGIRRGVAFNYVPGRNNVVGNTASRLGFTQDSRFSVEKLVKSGWSPISRNQTYARYNEILSLCLKKLPNYSLVSLEMALFTNAECECQLAMDSENLPNSSLHPACAKSRAGR